MFRNLVEAKFDFSSRVRAGLASGINYTVEDICAAFGLDGFEKRVVLYLLTLSVDSDSCGEVTPARAINFLSFNVSLGEKMRRRGYFSYDCKLSEANIIEVVKRGYSLGEPSIKLSERFKAGFYACLSGDVFDWEEFSGESDEPGDAAGGQNFETDAVGSRGTRGGCADV